jgi:hypothetical protein
VPARRWHRSTDQEEAPKLDAGHGTVGTVDNRGGDILDNGVTVGRTGNGNARVATPLVAGAGHVQPDLALDPGLVYDAGERDYVDFLCALSYTSE